MGKDGGRGNEWLCAKALAACYVAEGGVGGPKIPPDLPAYVSLSKCPESKQRDLYIRRNCTC